MTTTAPADIRRKTAAIKCPDPDDDSRLGQIQFVVATLDAVDKQGDVFLPGSVGRQDVLISQFQHAIWMGAVPIGKGVVYEQGGQVLCDAQLNMELSQAREVWSAIAFAPELIEASIGFQPTKYGWGERDGQRVCLFEKTHFWEASPVIVGAGVDTGVNHIKAAGAEPVPLSTPAALNIRQMIANLKEVCRE